MNVEAIWYLCEFGDGTHPTDWYWSYCFGYGVCGISSKDVVGAILSARHKRYQSRSYCTRCRSSSTCKKGHFGEVNLHPPSWSPDFFETAARRITLRYLHFGRRLQRQPEMDVLRNCLPDVVRITVAGSTATAIVSG